MSEEHDSNLARLKTASELQKTVDPSRRLNKLRAKISGHIYIFSSFSSCVKIQLKTKKKYLVKLCLDKESDMTTTTKVNFFPKYSVIMREKANRTNHNKRESNGGGGGSSRQQRPPSRGDFLATAAAVRGQDVQSKASSIKSKLSRISTFSSFIYKSRKEIELEEQRVIDEAAPGGTSGSEPQGGSGSERSLKEGANGSRRRSRSEGARVPRNSDDSSRGPKRESLDGVSSRPPAAARPLPPVDLRGTSFVYQSPSESSATSNMDLTRRNSRYLDIF